jgi:hypothetical protein
VRHVPFARLHHDAARGKGKAFWVAEITKMVNVYAAPIPEPDREAIAEYLAAHY